MRTLRPYQTEAVEKFLATAKPHRLLLAHAVGAGKSFTSLAAMRAAGVTRLLIVTPAIVRENWAREVKETLGFTAGVIRHGPDRKLPAKLEAERDQAYASAIIIVSYELLGKVRAGPWEGIIFDEIHHLRNLTSSQSRKCRGVVHLNSDAHILGLSGTLVPKDARSIWNPVDTLWPEYFGGRNRKGSIGWAYLQKYCEKEVTAYGTRFYGLRADAAEKLRDKLAPISHRVITQDFAHYLPPLHVQPLVIWDSRPDILKIAYDWYQNVKHDVDHIGIYCHHRDTASALVAHLRTGFLVTGMMPAKDRDTVLQACRGSESSLIVGTTHALAQGVSLSFQKAVLVIEWVTAPDQIIQFIGRFARQDSTNNLPTQVQFVVGPNDTGRAEKLCKRIEDINTLLKPGTSETIAQEAFQQEEMGDDEFEASVARLITGAQKRAQLWDTEDDTPGDDDEA